MEHPDEKERQISTTVALTSSPYIHILQSGIYEIDDERIARIYLDGKREEIIDIAASSHIELFDTLTGLLILDADNGTITTFKAGDKKIKPSAIFRQSGKPLTKLDTNISRAVWSDEIGCVIALTENFSKSPDSPDLLGARKIRPSGWLSPIAQIPRCRFDIGNPSHILEQRGSIYISYTPASHDNSDHAVMRIFDLTSMKRSSKTVHIPV